MKKNAAKDCAELCTIETIGHLDKTDCIYSVAFNAFIAGVEWHKNINIKNS
jgi:hypothetical protein